MTSYFLFFQLFYCFKDATGKYCFLVVKLITLYNIIIFPVYPFTFVYSPHIFPVLKKYSVRYLVTNRWSRKQTSAAERRWDVQAAEQKKMWN